MQSNTKHKIVFPLILSCLLSITAFAQDTDYKGTYSRWISAGLEESSGAQIGVRYIPELKYKKKLSKKYSLDVEMSLNTYASSLFYYTNDNFDANGDIKPYRSWMRLKTDNFEIRAGLQKINFGSAMFMRPLMWFDRIDQRDPLQLTDGVYAVLFRYYFKNNANIYLWGLYANDDLKGWEVFPTYDKSPEFGGRIQIPVSKGEVAIAYHHRQMDVSSYYFGERAIIPNINENRIGIDGKFDLKVGLWFEGVLTHSSVPFFLYDYTRMLNIGMDYTFGVGNGINVMGEYFRNEITKSAFEGGESLQFIAGSASYPLGILDNIRAIVYYEPDNKNWYRFISFQRQYDNISIYLMAFWNPEGSSMYQTRAGNNNLLGGKGIQMMLVYNH